MKLYDPTVDCKKTKLPNGLEVYSLFMDRPWVRVKVLVHSGARHDPVHLPGLAHFVEHLVSGNVSGYPYEKLRGFFEQTGGHANFGTTSFFSTYYDFAVPLERDYFAQGLELFGRMLVTASLERDVEKERKIIEREYFGRYPFPEKLEWVLRPRRALFKGHRLSSHATALGFPSGFMASTQADLQTFFDTHYTPANISLVVVGGIRLDELLDIIQKSPFGFLKKGIRSQLLPPYTPLPILGDRKLEVKHSDHSSFQFEETRYSAEWAFPTSLPHQLSLVLRMVLDEILFSEVREKRELAYQVSTDNSYFQDAASVEINARINPIANEEIDDIVTACIASIEDNREMVERNIQSLINSSKMNDVSGSRLVSSVSDSLISFHQIETLAESIGVISSLTFEDVVDASRFLSPDRRYTTIIKP